ncbi:MAG: phosphohistidine phosphatase SixA [Methanoregula sp.]|uniref:phosphohistidine phosphatase SixA n=1 Tax=Methanoregula sp. TaxID=2052170 RepID=UPI0025E22E44|nr:phosphohistidine phosphatase SixA [Methanoregula sp.]MCK9630230.1 phosphohistidine phosphatase SixA [Methanoregula sp.]
MDVFILRHGKAEVAKPGGRDADRPLTKKGRDDILAVALWIAAHDPEFDLIAASPLARAQETAAIIADVLEVPQKMATWKVLVPGGDTDTVCREIGRYPDNAAVLLVGHEPLLSSLISRIISGNEGAGIVMTKGGLAKIRNFSYAGRPSGELHWLLTVKQMALIK